MSFYITIKNQLLEQKHVERMGASVWLFMWLIDKVMAINENGVGKVMNGRPVLFEEIHKDLGMSDRTYRRWVKTLEEAAYIRTIRAPYGLIFYVNKAAKMWGQKAPDNNQTMFPDERTAKNGRTKKLIDPKTKKTSAKSAISDRPEMTELPTKNGRSNNNNSSNSNTKTNKHAAVAAKSPIGQLYYQVIKAYELPVTNHNVIWAKIKQWEKEDDPQKAINYLKFLLNQYPAIELKYKPQINTALDIYSKRVQIKNALTSEIKKSNNRKIMEV